MSEHPFDGGLGHGAAAGAVLGEEAVRRRFEVDDTDAGVISREQAERLSADLAAEVGGVPDEGLLGAEVFASPFAGGLDDRALVIGWGDAEFLAQVVEGDYWEVGSVVADPCVLPRPG